MFAPIKAKLQVSTQGKLDCRLTTFQAQRIRDHEQTSIDNYN